MAAPTLENGPYVFNVNNLYTETSAINIGKKVLLELKNALVALGGAGTIWTVIASSDNSSVKNTDDSAPFDLWDTITDVNYGTGAHSWCLLENSTTGGQLCFDYNQSAYTECDVFYSPGGTYSTDGTTSARPTATDAYQVTNEANDFWTTSSLTLKAVVNVMTSADHKTTRWYVHGKNSSTGVVGGYFGSIEHVANPPSEWTSTNPTCLIDHSGVVALSSTTTEQTPKIANVDTTSLKCFVETADPYAGWELAYPTMEAYGDFSADNCTTINTDEINLEIIGGYPVCPIGIFKAGGTYGGNLGRLRDIYWAQSTHATLDTYPADASRTWVKWGCFMVPWNGTLPQDAV